MMTARHTALQSIKSYPLFYIHGFADQEWRIATKPTPIKTDPNIDLSTVPEYNGTNVKFVEGKDKLIMSEPQIQNKQLHNAIIKFHEKYPQPPFMKQIFQKKTTWIWNIIMTILRQRKVLIQYIKKKPDNHCETNRNNTAEGKC